MRTYHFTEERPWGGFTNLLETENYKVKEMIIFPGKRVSYQRHQKRAEHWFIVQGKGRVTLDDVEHDVSVGDTVDVATQQKHRIGNVGEENLIFIEVQTGTYFGEDDIERLSDDYNRLPSVIPRNPD